MSTLVETFDISSDDDEKDSKAINFCEIMEGKGAVKSPSREEKLMQFVKIPVFKKEKK